MAGAPRRRASRRAQQRILRSAPCAPPLTFSRSSKPQSSGVMAPTSMAPQTTSRMWLRMRVISRNMTRMTDARRGTSMFSSFSTASEYPCSDAIIET